MKRKSVTVMSAYIILALLIGCGVNEEAETESYLSINTLQLNSNSDSKVPEISIAYDEDFVT